MDRPTFRFQVPGGSSYEQSAYRPFGPGMSGNPAHVFDKLLRQLQGKLTHLQMLKGGRGGPSPAFTLDTLTSLEGLLSAMPAMIQKQGGSARSMAAASASAEGLRAMLSPQPFNFSGRESLYGIRMGGSSNPLSVLGALGSGSSPGSFTSSLANSSFIAAPKPGRGPSASLASLLGGSERRPPRGPAPTVGMRGESDSSDGMPGDFLTDDLVAGLMQGKAVGRRNQGGGGAAAVSRTGGVGLTRAVSGLTRAINALTQVIRRGSGGAGGSGGGLPGSAAGGGGEGSVPVALAGATPPSSRGGFGGLGALGAAGGLSRLLGIGGGAGALAALTVGAPVANLVSSWLQFMGAFTEGTSVGTEDEALTKGLFGDNALGGLVGGRLGLRQNLGLGDSRNPLFGALFKGLGARGNAGQAVLQQTGALPFDAEPKRQQQGRAKPPLAVGEHWIDRLMMDESIKRDGDPHNPANIEINRQPDYNEAGFSNLLRFGESGWAWDGDYRLGHANFGKHIGRPNFKGRYLKLRGLENRRLPVPDNEDYREQVPLYEERFKNLKNGTETSMLPVSDNPKEQAILDDVIRTRFLDGASRSGPQSMFHVPSVGQFV